MTFFEESVNQVVGLANLPKALSLLFANLWRRTRVGIGMMGFGLAAEGCSGTTWLEIVEKFPGEIDFLTEKSPASIEQGCFRVKIHSHQGSL